MASIEYIQKRIEGKEKEIEKLNKKLGRINEAKVTNWEKNPYCYSELDIQVTQKELEKAEQVLKKYNNQLQVEIEKSNSRNIPAIVEFLDKWKSHMIDYYTKAYHRFLEDFEEWTAYSLEYHNWYNTEGVKFQISGATEYKERSREYNLKHAAFKARWSFLSSYLQYSHADGTEGKHILILDKIKKDVTAEANAKYDYMIEKTNAIVGQIVDASGLSISETGELNGIIYGTKANASITTIGAGGYNIQCYHFRTLIRPFMREI